MPQHEDRVKGYALFAHCFSRGKDIVVRLQHERVHAEDRIDCKEKIERITRRITLVGDLDPDQRRRLLEIADKCPVHRTLEGEPQIVTELVD